MIGFSIGFVSVFVFVFLECGKYFIILVVGIWCGFNYGRYFNGFNL